MMDMKKLKGLVEQLSAMVSESDSEVVEEKEQYAREDDEGDMSDGEDASEGKMKAKAMAAMLKKKMEGA
jgi:hypothetical protein